MKKMKVLSGLITILLVLAMSTTAFAQGKIYVDLQEVVSDTPPQIVNNRTMVPVRAISEMLGYDVEWFPENQQVEVYEQGDTMPLIVMNIDSTSAHYLKYDYDLGEYVTYEVTLDSPATLINNRTFVPLRFISEAVGYTVDWDADNFDVYLFSPEYMANQEGEGMGEDLGTNQDGIGEDQGIGTEPVEPGEGIGEVIPLSIEEIQYLTSQTTNSWLAMTPDEKSDIVTLIGRWWEEVDGYVVADYDQMVADLDHQMEQYYRNGVDAFLFDTACDIYGMDISKYIAG